MRQLYTILLLTISMVATAQQEAIFSQFFYQKALSNPGAAGSQGIATLSAFHRQQWIGLDGAPTSQVLSFNAPVFANRVGLGLTLVNDRIGFFNGTYINMGYAYRIDFGNGSLGIGMQGSYRRQRADWDEVQTITQRPDQVMGENDAVPHFNVGAGIHYENERFFGGIAVPYLLEKGFTKKYEGIANNFTGTTPHLFINAGWILPIHANLRLRPAFATRVVEHTPPDFDFHFSVGFLENSRLWAGTTLRWGQSKVTTAGDALVLMCQYQLNQHLNTGFAYDISINGLQQQNSGTYELMLEYRFAQKEGAVHNPRFFW